MCTNFTPTKRAQWVKEKLGVDLPTGFPDESYPGFAAPVVVKSHQTGRVACGLAKFGLIPSWAKDDKISRHTYNARSETAAEKPSYRSAWRHRQYGLVLVDNFYEPSYESGRAVRWKIELASGDPFGIACLWDRWTDPASGELVVSFSMLTVNADEHPVMNDLRHSLDFEPSKWAKVPELIAGHLWHLGDLRVPNSSRTIPIYVACQIQSVKEEVIQALDSRVRPDCGVVFVSARERFYSPFHLPRGHQLAGLDEVFMFDGATIDREVVSRLSQPEEQPTEENFFEERSGTLLLAHLPEPRTFIGKQKKVIAHFWKHNSLLWVITTAGSNRAGICYEVRTFVTKLLDGVFEDDTQFGIIYGLDDGDDWTTEESLIKANPNWGISVRSEILGPLQAKAMQLPSAVNNFKTKHLNEWVNADSGVRRCRP